MTFCRNSRLSSTTSIRLVIVSNQAAFCGAAKGSRVADTVSRSDPEATGSVFRGRSTTIRAIDSPKPMPFALVLKNGCHRSQREYEGRTGFPRVRRRLGESIDVSDTAVAMFDKRRLTA